MNSLWIKEHKHRVIKRISKYISIATTGLLMLSTSNLLAQTNSDIALLPTQFVNQTVKPKIILSLDTSGSMLDRAYIGDRDYNEDREYAGFFNSGSCYRYNNTNEYFVEIKSRSPVNCGDVVSNDSWSGNFLNWLAMRRIDIVRQVLIGGVVKAVIDTPGADSEILTRMEYIDSNIKADYFIVEGENITIWNNGTTFWEVNGPTVHLSPNSNDQYSPYTNALYTICSQKIIIGKNRTRIPPGALDEYCSDPSTNTDQIDSNLKNQVEQVKIRLKVDEAPTGLLLDKSEDFVFGLSVYNIDHTLSANTIIDDAVCPDGYNRTNNNCNFKNSIYAGAARSGSKQVDGGTLQPCFPDENKLDTTRTNYDKCYQTYAGAPLENLVDVIEYYPVAWGGTPLAETMIEIGGYIKQIDFGNKQSEGPQYFNPSHMANLVPDSTNDFKPSYQLGKDPSSDSAWDPYYDTEKNKLIPCTPIYVISLSDGGSFKDDISAINYPGVNNDLWRRGDGEGLDTAAWFLRGDCRPTLAGQQDVRSYYVFADLSNQLDLSGVEVRRLREAAAIGSVDIEEIDDSGNFQIIGSPFSDQNEPFNDLESGFARISSAETATATSWDKNADGEVDHFLLATSADQLVQQISAVLNDIGGKTSASNGAAVVNMGSSGAGAVYQALYHPKLSDDSGRTVKWSGSVWGLFLDQNANFREDSDGDGQLDADDLVLKYSKDINGITQVKKFHSSDLLSSVATVSLEDIQPIWNATEYLAKINDSEIVNNRLYQSNQYGRHIIYGNKNFVTKKDFDSLNLYDDFIADNFDHTDAHWFDIDCSSVVDEGNKPGNLDECENEVDSLVNWIRGLDQLGKRNRLLDSNHIEGQAYQRLGDVVSSTPTVVGSPSASYDLLNGDTSYEQFKGKYAHRRQVVYVGGNDGMLHAFNAGFWYENDLAFKLNDPSNDKTEHPLGAELWAYIPANLLPHLKWLDDDSYQHAFYVDGDPQAFDVKIFDSSDVDHPGGWGTILVVPMRMGGSPITINDNGTDFTARSSLLIFDVTNPEKQPELLAEFNDDKLGFTTSRPSLVMDVDNSGTSTTSQWHLVFGSGPNVLASASVTPGTMPTLYRLDLNALVDDPHLAASTTKVGNADGFIGDITSIDWNLKDINQGYSTDIVAFGTINTTDSPLKFSGALYTLNPFVASPEASLIHSAGQAITAAPNYSLQFSLNNTQKWLYSGTGKLMVPADNINTDLQTFYGLKVDDSGQNLQSGELINTSNIDVDTEGQLLCASTCPNGETTYRSFQKYTASSSVSGWRIDLENSAQSSDPSGRNLGRSLIYRELVLFTEYVPPAEVCDLEGNSYLYALDAFTGTSTPYSPIGSFAAGSGSNNISSKFTLLDNSLVKDISVVTDSKGQSKVVYQDGNGGLGEEALKGFISAFPSGRASWRQIILD